MGDTEGTGEEKSHTPWHLWAPKLLQLTCSQSTCFLPRGLQHPEKGTTHPLQDHTGGRGSRALAGR